MLVNSQAIERWIDFSYRFVAARATPTRQHPGMTSKAKWAEGKAAELRATAERQRRQGFGGSYAGAARRGQAVRRIEAQAWRLEAYARRQVADEPFDLPF